MAENFEINLINEVKEWLMSRHYPGSLNGDSECAYYGFSPYSDNPKEWDGMYLNDPAFLHENYDYVMNTITGKWAKSE